MIHCSKITEEDRFLATLSEKPLSIWMRPDEKDLTIHKLEEAGFIKRIYLKGNEVYSTDIYDIVHSYKIYIGECKNTAKLRQRAKAGMQAMKYFLISQ